MQIYKVRLPLLFGLAAFLAGANPAAAQDRLCDPGGEDCRSVLLNYIRNEQVGIDVAFWFMEDARYTTALIERHRAGVPVRVLIDTRANSTYNLNADRLRELQDAGIPMRRRLTNYILHWKMMLFHGQNVVQFSGANYSADAWRPGSSTPYENYTDEVIYFTGDPAIVNSFRTKYDDHWTDTSGWADYANVTGPLTRSYDVYPKDPSLNFPPAESFRNRSLTVYRNEQAGLDVIMYRITDRNHTDAVLAAVARGVPVRLITEPRQYRDPSRLWHSWNVDRLYMGGVRVKHRAHAGLNHQKSVIAHSQRMAIFGSSNWTSASNAGQVEHNIFTTKPDIYSWLVNQFERKWNNTGGVVENVDFVPLPPDTPRAPEPADGSTAVSTTPTLRWYGGPWAHLYDVYLGTTAGSLSLVAENVQLGPSESSTQMQSFRLPSALQPGTTYYWRIVSKTMALQQRSSLTWSFTTAGTAPAGTLPSGWASRDIGSVGATGSANVSGGVYTLTGAGADIWGSSDAFHFAYTSLSGDGTIVARVATVDNVHAWTKSGVMMRDSLTAGSAHASVFVTPGRGVAFQRRVSSGGSSTHTAGPSATAPYWVRIDRAGSVFTAYASANGSSWTQIGRQTISMGATIYIGLALSSHVAGTLAGSTMDNVSLSQNSSASTLPSGWSSSDVGAVNPAGAASFSGGVFTVTGSGADIWGTADAFHFAYTTLSGNGTVVARVGTLENVDQWTKAGVMMRETLSAGSKHASMFVSPSKGLAFQRRASTGGTSTHTAGPSATAPYWVRLERSGDTFTASVSVDGSSWTTVGSETIPMSAAILVGLPVTSHRDGRTATATFDNVSVTGH